MTAEGCIMALPIADWRLAIEESRTLDKTRDKLKPNASPNFSLAHRMGEGRGEGAFPNRQSAIGNRQS
jgi:hypothetical protein